MIASNDDIVMEHARKMAENRNLALNYADLEPSLLAKGNDNLAFKVHRLAELYGELADKHEEFVSFVAAIEF